MEFIGTWTFESSENFEEYMKALGVGMLQRKIGSTLKPTYHISKDGNTWIIKMESSVKSTETRFVDGVEFDEETIDGRKSKTTFTLECDKMVQVQKDPKSGEVYTTITREVKGDKLITTLRVGNVLAIRVFKRA